jgi:hypothetical protein
MTIKLKNDEEIRNDFPLDNDSYSYVPHLPKSTKPHPGHNFQTRLLVSSVDVRGVKVKWSSLIRSPRSGVDRTGRGWGLFPGETQVRSGVGVEAVLKHV